jgi:glycerol kinase
MSADGAPRPAALRVDGGMAANDWLCQFLADVLETPVERPLSIETTALGAAFLAGLAIGFWPGLEAISKTWSVEKRFEPSMDAAFRDSIVAGWKDALERALL